MLPLIIIVTIILFAVFIGFTWRRLEGYGKKEKVIICLIGIIISWIITSTLFWISSREISYEKMEIEKKISQILISVFTPINGIILIPYLAKIMSKIKIRELQKEELIKKITIFLLIIIIIFIIETKYLTNIQLGIFELASSI